MNSAFKCGMALALVTIGGTAAAQSTYNVDFLINAFPGENELIQGTITTDGHTGPLAASDITSWSLFSDSAQTPFSASGGPGSVSMSSSPGLLSASASALTYNFTMDGFVFFQSASGAGVALQEITTVNGDDSFILINNGNGYTPQYDVLPVSTVFATVSAPEIDPASAAGAFTLLLGTLAVLRGRQPKRVDFPARR